MKVTADCPEAGGRPVRGPGQDKDNINSLYRWCKKVTVYEELTKLVVIKEIGYGIGGVTKDKKKVGRRY